MRDEASAQDGMWAPTGSTGSRAGDREEEGEFLKDDFLKRLISTDFLHLKLLFKCA